MRRGLLVAALWKESEEKWYLTVARRQSGGGWGSWSTPATLVTSAKRGADLVLREDRILEFSYRTTGDVLTLLTCRKVSNAGVGTFS